MKRDREKNCLAQFHTLDETLFPLTFVSFAPRAAYQSQCPLCLRQFFVAVKCNAIAFDVRLEHKLRSPPGVASSILREDRRKSILTENPSKRLPIVFLDFCLSSDLKLVQGTWVLGQPLIGGDQLRICSNIALLTLCARRGQLSRHDDYMTNTTPHPL